MTWGSFKHNVKWDTAIGSASRNVVMRIGLRLLRRGRKMLKWSGGRCSWCGRIRHLLCGDSRSARMNADPRIQDTSNEK